VLFRVGCSPQLRFQILGESLLEDARGILRDVNEAIMRAGKVAHRTGTLRVGFIESLSWHGVVPRSFRQFSQRHPDATLELRSLSSLDQVEAVRLGELDAGYVYRPLIKDRNLAHIQVALHSVMLALPLGHSLLKVTPLRLRDLRGTSFVWFSKRTNPVFYRQLMLCLLKIPIARKSLKLPERAGNLRPRCSNSCCPYSSR
jgi:DNA-binding transcriptional LysR family regulator